MKEHKGKITEQAIKNGGYQMKALANKLGISRSTLYTRLKDPDLSDPFILKVGRIIHYDFTRDFPHLSDKINQDRLEEQEGHYHYDISKNPDFCDLQVLEAKYLKLLEDYNKLLRLLTLLANNNDLSVLKQEIADFLEEQETESLM